MSTSSLVGAWKLLVIEFRSDGQVVYPVGRDAAGMCLYDASGHMSLQIMRVDRPRFALNDHQNGTPEEIAAAFKGYLAYGGTYVEDADHGVVVHHVMHSLFPNWIGTDLVRFFKRAGNRLIVSAPTQTVAGHLMDAMLVWELVSDVERT
ncbi:MAG TPA: lipocalin-like domain-containing protein [Thermoanaerobaculia bacterium]|nr:lipocalin-like domain-containing protein [Thermoanaerobaculia bacterium]